MLSHVTLEQAQEGWFVVECPALPGDEFIGCCQQANILTKPPLRKNLGGFLLFIVCQIDKACVF